MKYNQKFLQENRTPKQVLKKAKKPDFSKLSNPYALAVAIKQEIKPKKARRPSSLVKSTYEKRLNDAVKSTIEFKTIELLRSLHAFNRLNLPIILIISDTLSVDAVALCKREGITYVIDKQ